MTDSQLESLLREIPAPEIPASWRAEILATARREARPEPHPRRNFPPLLLWLRALVTRNPLTAGALTAMWLLILLFHATTPIDRQQQEILAHTDLSQPLHLITMADEIRLVEIAETTPNTQRQIP
jgi:hypothetical protein